MLNQMDILVPDYQAYHISFLVRLLDLTKKCNIINTNYTKSLTTHSDYKKYYEFIISQVPNAKKTITNVDFFLRNFAILTERSTFNRFVHLTNGKTINDTEIEFLKIIEHDGIIPKGAHTFGVNADATREFINWSLERMFKRKTSENEVKFHATDCIHKKSSVMSWLLTLHLCEEGQKHKYNQFFTEYTETKKRIAVVFCGYVRSYNAVYSSHMKLLKQPNVDVFIHTWNNIGFKNKDLSKKWLNDQSPKLDVENIVSIYKPVKIKVENDKNILDSLSLIGKINPIFAYNGQAKDDCSKYINSQLYSIYEGYKLVEEYEKEQGFNYDVIIKLRFDFNISYLSINGIFSDTEGSAIWFPHCHLNHHGHAGGGGGCKKCDTEESVTKPNHPKHTNDFCDIWFYGRRDVVQKAFELFLHGQKIMEKNHTNNLNTYKKLTHSIDNEYIYTHNLNDIETKMVCFYPERLLREHLEEYPCRSSCNIQGHILQKH
jgi:hypothetical protein